MYIKECTRTDTDQTQTRPSRICIWIVLEQMGRWSLAEPYAMFTHPSAYDEFPCVIQP